VYCETPDIIPFASPFKSELLKPAQLATLQAGTLRLLDEVDVHFPSRPALEILSGHGARVDMDTQTVRIRPDLVQKAMSTAPRSFVLVGREERFDLTLDGSCSYLCIDGTGVHVVDLETHQMRPSRKEDVALMVRVCDALPLGDVRKRARAKLDRIWVEHEPEPLYEVAQAELLVILDVAEREMDTQRYGFKERAGS
jgi:trimethylamine--corrinoid protein Co-methyltransferase